MLTLNHRKESASTATAGFDEKRTCIDHERRVYSGVETDGFRRPFQAASFTKRLSYGLKLECSSMAQVRALLIDYRTVLNARSPRSRMQPFRRCSRVLDTTLSNT